MSEEKFVYLNDLKQKAAILPRDCGIVDFS